MAITFGPGITLSGSGLIVAVPLNSPTVTGVVVSGTTATVSFTAPTPNGNPPPLYYVATSTPGNLTGNSVTSPITVTGLSTGTSYTFAVTAVNAFGAGNTVSQNYVNSVSNGNSLYTWGTGPYGELGLGNLTNYSSPVQVGALTNWKSMGAGYRHVVAVKTDGTLWAWGNNGGGQLGLNSQVQNYSSPVQVGALTNWQAVDCGLHMTLALKTNGTLWSWGYGAYGQLGLVNGNSYSSPKQIGSLTNWKSIAVGHTRGMAIRTDGTLWSWGCNTYGQLGLGTSGNGGSSANTSSPQQVGALTNWLSITAGYLHNLALQTNGSLWSWGNNLWGNLGLNSVDNGTAQPTQVGVLTTWSSTAAGRHSAANSAAIKNDGTVWAWGSIWGYSSPVQVDSSTNWSNIAAGQNFYLGIKTDGTLWSGFQQVGSLTSWLSAAAGPSFSLATQSNIATAPNAPTGVTATSSGTTAVISYTPAAAGSSATSYTAVSTPGAITASTSSGAITMTGLADGTNYTFQVYGTNSAGTGVYSQPSNSIFSSALFLSATGGSITTACNYRYHTFVSSGTFSITAGSSKPVCYIVVGGGGGGGYGSRCGCAFFCGGGGGSGGVVVGASVVLSSPSLPIVVGTGGAGGHGRFATPAYTVSTNGGCSTFNGVTAYGGGAGGINGGNGANGGSGGGWSSVSTGAHGGVGTGIQPSSSSGGYGANGSGVCGGKANYTWVNGVTYGGSSGVGVGGAGTGYGGNGCYGYNGTTGTVIIRYRYQ